MINHKLIEQDILEGGYPENIKDQVVSLVKRIEELEGENRYLKNNSDNSIEFETYRKCVRGDI
ncbi:hypothetical protein CIL05_07250 [Virgibacillus profundi]|uniref:Uncharacterized protein n=1 Tax=Virgibacillus profundi TaxID=2024555 RepID=A0A2A2IF30_9BACI|nr:hypothetical protein [Virgibacillus profundi]PAV30257.1 hypothetical protein CIL05_07250 [Virgibacillus profundi]PXY54429.1 hypothetical protein CIT14_07335 [Virgibacillus profundi]